MQNPPTTPIALDELTQLLNRRYFPEYGTLLLGGFDEPFYAAGGSGRAAEIRFTRDYLRSALHELAHWCIAGAARRQVDDFGYWYAPDGRSEAQQQEFYRVEIKPQALEWALSIVCGAKFEVSTDNLSNPVTSGADEFKQAVAAQLRDYLEHGFPSRAEAMLQLLHNARWGGDGLSLYQYLAKQLAVHFEGAGMDLVSAEPC